MLRYANVWLRGLDLWVELGHTFAVDNHLGNIFVQNNG